jgi:hypothetical protein
VLLGALVAVATTSMVAGPAWARVRRPTATTTTTSTTTTFLTTTTAPTTMPVPAAPAPAPPDTCVKGAWPTVVQGRPLAFQAGDGVYLWNDPDGGWALRATHTGPSDGAVISGTLTTGGKFVDVRRVQYEGDDIVAVGASKHTILFRFVNYGWLDGLDFATRCSSAISATIYIGGGLASTTAVHLGGSASSPATNPFRVERTRQSVAAGLETVPLATTAPPATSPTSVS